MKNIVLDRAEQWDITDSIGQRFRVQFWDTHQEDRLGKRRMAIAVFTNGGDMWPNKWNLMLKSSRFYPGTRITCDGAEAATHAVDMACNMKGLECYFDDGEALDASSVDSDDGGHWL